MRKQRKRGWNEKGVREKKWVDTVRHKTKDKGRPQRVVGNNEKQRQRWRKNI